MSMWLQLMLLVMFVEAMTEILTESSLFRGIREFLGKRSSLLGELVHCGYCTSVWVSAAVAWILVLKFTPYYAVDYIITTFIVHRLSNMLHELYSKWMGRRPWSMALYKTETVVIPESGEHNESK